MNKVYCENCEYYYEHADCSRCSSRNFFDNNSCGNNICDIFNLCKKNTEEYIEVAEDAVNKEVKNTRYKRCREINSLNNCKDFTPIKKINFWGKVIQ